MNLSPQDVLLILFVIVCAVTDLKKRKIYNIATFPAIILGLGLNGIYNGFAGLKESALGVLVGFLMLYFFYLGGGIGAGDVKFLMGVGALKGTSFVFQGAICGILLSGIVVIFWMFFHGTLLKSLKNIIFPLFTSAMSGFKVSPLPKTKSPALPFGFYLATGILIYFFYIKFVV